MGDSSKVAAFVLIEDESFKGGYLGLSASDKYQVVNVGEDNRVSSFVGEDARVSFDRVEANRGEKTCELLIPETRGATEAVQGFVEPGVSAIR